MSKTQTTPIRLPPEFAPLMPYMDKFQRDVVGTVEDTADTALSTATAAQDDATLSLAQVQALAVQNAADLKKANFLRQWYGS